MVIEMEIRIQSQNALIGIEGTNGQYSIQQNQWPMKLRSIDAKSKIKMTDAVLLIDQRQCFSEAGLKGIMEINRIYAAKGRNAALEGIARIAREGKEMASISKNKGPVIAKIAKRNRFKKSKEVRFDMIPKSRPKITVIPGEVTGEFTKGYIEMKMGNIKPNIEYYPGKLDIYLKQKNKINIEFVGNKLDTYVG